MTDQLNNYRAVIYSKIEEIANAEKITRKVLAELSRELFEYVRDTNDIDAVNRLLGVLTPMNRLTAIHFFSHFMPREVEKDKEGKFSRFGKLVKGQKRIDKCEAMIAEFLADENNNIWTWAKANLTVEKKKRNLAQGVQDAVRKALAGTPETDGYEEAEPLSAAEVLAAVYASGISLEDAVAATEAFSTKVEEAMELASAQGLMETVNEMAEAA